MIFSKKDKEVLSNRLSQKKTENVVEQQSLTNASKKVKTALSNAYAALEKVAKETPDLLSSVGIEPQCVYKGKGLFAKQVFLYDLGITFGFSRKLYLDLKGNIMTATWNGGKPILSCPKSGIIEWFDYWDLSSYGNVYTRDTDTTKMHIRFREDITGFLLSVAYGIRPTWDSLSEDYVYSFILVFEKSESEKIALLKKAFLHYAEKGNEINSVFIT